jgi:hypothetical protein
MVFQSGRSMVVVRGGTELAKALMERCATPASLGGTMRATRIILVPITFLAMACATADDRSFELWEGPAQGRIAGLVVDVDGAPIEDVQVFLGSTGQGSFTDPDGAFSIREVEPGEAIVVHFRAEGYTHADRKLSLTDWETRSLKVELQPVGRTFRFLAEDGAHLQEGDLELRLPPQAFVNARGQRISGEMELDLTVSDIANDGLAGAPGSFRGVGADGVERSIMSFGFFQVEARQGDELLNLAEDATAEVSFRVSDEMTRSQEELLGDTVDLWWWNPDEAIWEFTDASMVEEDASGERTMRAELPHFSSWNFDEAYESSCAEFHVVDAMGNPVVGAWLQMSGISYEISHYSGYEEGSTDEDGVLTLMGAPWGMAELGVSVTMDGGTIEQTYTVGLEDVYEDPSSCPYQYRVELPICFVGGDLGVTAVAVFDGSGSPNPTRLMSGVGMFYEPSASYGVCEEPLGGLEPGWQILDPGDLGAGGDPTETGLLDPSDLTIISAGDFVRFTDGEGLDLDLTALEVNAEGSTIYELDPSDAMDLDIAVEGATAMTVSVQGELSGMPGFELPHAMLVPGAVLPLNVGGGAVLPCSGTATVQVDWPADDSNTLVAIPLDGDRMAVGVVEPGSTVEIPPSVTSLLPRGEDFQLTTFRSSWSFQRLPNGTYGRLQAANVVTTTARCQD